MAIFVINVVNSKNVWNSVITTVALLLIFYLSTSGEDTSSDVE